MLLYTYSLGGVSGYYEAERQGYAAQYPYDTSKRIEECALKSDPSAVQECIEQAIASGHENQRSEGDLKAQRQMADYAFWMLIISIVQIPMTLGGLIALIITIRQGQEANQITRDALTIEQRAWLHLTVDFADDFERRNTWGAKFNLIAKNIGRTPALNTIVRIRMHFDDGSAEAKSASLTKLFKELRAIERTEAKVHAMPDDAYRREMPAFIDAEIWNKKWRGFFDDPAEAREAIPLEFRAYIVAAVQYRTIFDAPNAAPRRTGIIADIRWANDDFQNEHKPIIDKVAKIDKRLLRLVHPVDAIGIID